jgi:hypothetical protein
VDWQRVWEVFEGALEQPESERGAWLARSCSADAILRQRVEQLLQAHDKPGGGVLDKPIQALPDAVALNRRTPAIERFGPYQVLEEIGRGGMGIVYRARDTRLGRMVALKALPEAVARDADRMRRFEREAQTMAAVNHPNIAAVYGLEEADGVRALVMELVEGPTLADRLAGRAMPLAEALPVARELAEALEAAHERGIVHRDFKPANIKVTPTGDVKVLDFGLAKGVDAEAATSSDSGPSTPLAHSATPSGVILGTASYMSPEQARGKPIDKRTDIWAFGVVLYEMLTGRQAFRGESISDTLACVLKSDPDWSALPESTPPIVRRLLARCLEKDARRRLRDIGEARILLEDLPETGETAPPPRSRRPVWIAAALAAAAGAALAWLAMRGAPDGPAAPLRKVELAVAAEFRDPMIAPDGKKVAYVAGNRLFVHDLGQFAAREVPGSEGATGIFWSPDSAHLAYVSAGKLWRAPALGGGARIVCVAPTQYEGAGGAWQPDGRMIFNTGGTGLSSVSADGGDPVAVLQPDKSTEIDFHHASPLPDGRGVLFVVHRRAGADTLAVFSGGARTNILTVEGQTLEHPVYSRTGHILYHRATGNPGVWALPFSVDAMRARGEAFLVVAGARAPSVSSEPAPTLAMIRGAGRAMTRPVLVSRLGKIEKEFGDPQPHTRFFDLSPDGGRLAVAVADAGASDIWIHDLQRGARTRLAATPEPETFPSWSADGKRLAFRRGSGIVVKEVEGTAESDTRVDGLYPGFSPSGDELVFAAPGANPAYYDLFRLPLAGGKPVVLLRSDARKSWPRVSPDGSYYAYMSDESGQYQVYLSQYPSGAGKWQVSVDGGEWPAWNRSSTRLYYADSRRGMWEVAVATGRVPRLAAPRKLFDRPERTEDAFAITGDGSGFLMLQAVEDPRRPTGVTLVESWFTEFGRGAR